MINKPNIVCIVLDHVTFMHYKLARGAKPILNTYERLAANGVEFVNARSVHPLCMPCRASMLTGVYSHKHGMTRNLGLHEDNPKYPLISSFLLDAGYKVGYFGKNHSGYDLEANKFEGFYPRDYGNPYLTERYKKYLEDTNFSSPIYRQEWGIWPYENGDYNLTQTDNFNTYSAGVLKNPSSVHEANFLINMAEDWIIQNKGNPYFLRLDFWGPHHAYTVPSDFADTIDSDDIEPYPSFYDNMEKRPKFIKDFADKIRKHNGTKSWDDYKHVLKRAYEHFTFMDNAIGKFIDGLENKNKENTIIIYTADHGDALGSHGGFVDKAGDMMEEVMRIPLVISAPDCQKNDECELLTSNLDLVPTILDLVGIEIPEYMDGRSLKPLISGTSDGWREDYMAEHYGHFQVHSVQRALYYRNCKYVATEGEIHELYDLETDPFEINNLIDNADYEYLLAEMRRRLLCNIEKFSDSDSTVLGIDNTL